MDSLILTENEKHLFDNLLKENNKDIGRYFSLIYRASIHGFRSKDCALKQKGKTKTLTLIETKSNNVFGAYTNYKWGSNRSSYWFHDHDTFLVLIRSSSNHKPNIFNHKNKEQYKKNPYSVQEYTGFHCIFGLNGAIMVEDGCNKTQNGQTNDNTSFNHPDKYHLNGGKLFFQVKEYEVWQCGNDF